MKVIEPGHIYQLQHLDGSGAGLLVFVNRETGTEHEGTQTQDVLRVLIDRTQHCDGCLRWDGNDKIIHHLRMALALHEARALERKTEKGVLKPELVQTGDDGHFIVNEEVEASEAEARVRRYGSTMHAADSAEYERIKPLVHLTPNDADDVVFLKDRLRSLYASVDELSAHGQLNQAATVRQDIVETHKKLNELETPAYYEGDPPTSMGCHVPPYQCSIPGCSESGLCEECRKRGAR